MPYRSYRSYRRFRRRRPFRRRRFGRPMYRRRFSRFTRAVKGIIYNTAENKYHNSSGDLANLVAGSSPFAFDTTLISQGTNKNTRVGTVIKPSNMLLKYKLELNDTSVRANARVFIVQNSVDAVPLNLPANPTQLFPTIEAAEVPYKVLHDKTYDMSLGRNQNRVVNVYLPRRRMRRIKWQGSASTPYRQGDIQIYVCTDNTTANALSFTYDSRIRYSDA